MSAELLPPQARPGEQPPEGSPGARSLLQRFLGEQDDLTAVERFSQWHSEYTGHRQRPYYESLIPQSLPEAGQQYSFEVNLDACSGCKACVTACHNLNGLDEGETWRDVGLLLGGTAELPVLQHVTTACHHCLDPGCLKGCPVEAYVKDPVTGIVKHLDDQCFGCQYCTWMCPYDVPKYNPAKGIVRKCDMCSSRLKAGEAPACVQACPHRAIRIRTVNIDDVGQHAAERFAIPHSPSVTQTLPTTHYISSRPVCDREQPVAQALRRPEHAHPPLIAMLLLTQIAVGGFVALALQPFVAMPVLIEAAAIMFSFACTVFGLGASLLHLGRPQFAFRAALGWRHSWLSREAIAFGLFGGAATLYSLSSLLTSSTVAQTLRPWLAAGTVLTGLVGLFCSVRIYHATQRPLWRFWSTGTRFFGTALLTCLTWLSFTHQWAVGAFMVVLIAKQAVEFVPLRWLRQSVDSPLRRSAMLMVHECRRAFSHRYALTVSAAFLIALSLPMPSDAPTRGPLVFLAGVALIFGEILERYLFFTCVAAPRMPGGE